MRVIKIATRKSPLALYQAEFVSTQLQKHYVDIKVELVKISTQGDKLLEAPLAKIGGKGLFIKELEIAMQQGKADIAVHSLKDIPYKMPDGFIIGAVLKRDNPLDAFVANKYNNINDLPIKSKIGTCSMRRIVQIKAMRPDLQIIDLRGNINTRLKKLDNNYYDAIILACAGLERLKLEYRIKQEFNVKESLPAVGQGAIGIEVLQANDSIIELIKPLIDHKTTLAVNAERAMNEKLSGSCSSPIAGFATINNNILTITGLVGSIKNSLILKESISGDKNDATIIGYELANKLLARGARQILQEN